MSKTNNPQVKNTLVYQGMTFDRVIDLQHYTVDADKYNESYYGSLREICQDVNKEFPERSFFIYVPSINEFFDSTGFASIPKKVEKGFFEMIDFYFIPRDRNALLHLAFYEGDRCL